MGISTADYIAMQQRLNKGKAVAPVVSALAVGAGKEEELCQEIIKACDARRWMCVRSRTDMPTTSMPGYPDFDIWAEGGRRFAIECKTKVGKLSPAQLGFHGWAERLGHKVYVVRSIAEFLEVIRTDSTHDTT